MKTNVLNYYYETIRTCANRIAIIDQQRKITFSELDLLTNAVADAIEYNVEKQICIPVAVFLPKCTECVISDIAIIKTGNTYMNLDIKAPDARVNSILEIIRPKVVITNNIYIERVAKLCTSEIILNIDGILEKGGNSDYKDNTEKLIDTDLLCIINTSGSTGTPKGVALNHRSFIDFIDWSLDTMDFYEHEVLGCLSPVIFDIYSYELSLLMAKGATMMLIPESLAAFPVKILQMMNEHKVTFIFWVPTIMVNISNMGLLDRIPLESIHIVWFAGEVFPTKQFNIWHRALPNVTFVNLYGPIEITLDCTYFIVDREMKDDEPLPIGVACKNTDILILKDNDELAEAGEEGELCVRGTSLAAGYYNNPEKTSAAFVQNPLNNAYPEVIYRTGDIAVVNEFGEIMFKGRKDTLVKHLGYRIELGEIEHIIINKLKMVENGCVVYDHVKKEIVFYYEKQEEISVGEFRKKIGTLLPKYMIPTVYIRIDEMPRNPNGKIDRLMLKEKLSDNC